MVRVNNRLYGFVDGKLSVSFPCSNISLRYRNIDFNRQRDGSNKRIMPTAAVSLKNARNIKL